MEINPAQSEFGSESERNVLLVTYVLFVVGLFTGGLATIAGVVICHLKKGEVADAALRSHYVWLIRTFWWSLLWTLLLWLAALTVILLVVLWPGLIALAIWYIYRIVRGALAFIERRPLPV